MPIPPPSEDASLSAVFASQGEAGAYPSAFARLTFRYLASAAFVLSSCRETDGETPLKALFAGWPAPAAVAAATPPTATVASSAASRPFVPGVITVPPCRRDGCAARRV